MTLFYRLIFRCAEYFASVLHPIDKEVMQIKKPDDVKSSEITSESLYFNRRTFLRGAILAGTAVATGFLYRGLNGTNRQATGSFSEPVKQSPKYVLAGEKTTD